MLPLAELIVIAGVMHLGLIVAGSLLPIVLNWRQELQQINPMSRHVIWVHGAFVMLTIVGFASISIFAAAELVAGSLLGRALCAFISLFWLARLAIQFLLFDARPHLRSWPLRVGYHALTVAFTYFAAIYGYAAITT